MMEDVKKDSQAIILYVKQLLSTIIDVPKGSTLRKGQGRRSKLCKDRIDKDEESKCHKVKDFKVNSRLDKH